MLSTALRGSYSQGLIHRKLLNKQIQGMGNPLKQKESAQHWKIIQEKGGNRQARMACLWTTGGLFTDTEAGKDPSQQIIGAECTGDFTQSVLGLSQILG